MSVEFGRPKTFPDALIRVPDRNDPEYNSVDGGPYEHCAHFREYLTETWSSVVAKTKPLKDIPLEGRMVPMETDDLKLLFQVNSFYRDLNNDVYTRDWAHIPKGLDTPWQDLLPEGTDEYRWWQITHFTPDIKLGWYRLYCIEMNNQFETKRTSVRFDENSEFEFVFATKSEIGLLKKALVGPTYS